MRFWGVMVLGFIGVGLLGFVSLPSAPINELAVAKEPYKPWSAWDKDADLTPLPRKSGLRIAIEGRLKWLGIELTSSPDASPGSSS